MSDPVHDRVHDSLVAASLRGLTWLVLRAPVFTIMMCVAAAGYCVHYSHQHLTFKTNRADLIDPQTDYHRRWLVYTEAFGDCDDMVVTVEAESPESIKQILDDLGPRVEAETQLFKHVLYKVDPAPLREKGLQYLSPDQLQSILTNLEELGPVLRGQWNLMTLRNMVRDVRGKISLASLGGKFGQSASEPMLISINRLVASLSKYTDNQDYQSPLDELVQLDVDQREEADQVRYLLNEKGTMGFLETQPVMPANDFNGATVCIDRMREILTTMQRRYPAAKFGLTGVPVLESDEMRDSQTSMTRASNLSMIGVALLLILGFRGFRHPMLGMVLLGVSMCFSFGFTTLAVGHLNILSVSFATMLVGLGIDFAIMYMSRYLQLRHEGYSLGNALVETSSSVGPGMLTTALTTAASFATAVMTDFRGMAELGIIVGGGILLCVLAAFLMMPPMLFLADRRTAVARLPVPIQAFALKQLISNHPGLLCAMSLAAIAFLGLQAFNVKYDANLLNLQAKGVDSVDVQQRIFDQSEGSLLYAVSLTDHPEEALKLKKKLLALPSVGRVEEVASMLPKYSKEQTNLLVQAIKAQLEKLPKAPLAPAVVNPEGVGHELQEIETLIAKWKSPVAVQARQTINRFLDQLAELPFDRQKQLLLDYQVRLKNDLLNQLKTLAASSNPEPVTARDLPSALAARFVSPNGKWMLQTYPKYQIWADDPLKKFVAEIRTADPEATGTPLQTYEATQEIFKGYCTVGGYALIATCLLVLMDFRNVLHMFLALLPPALGSVIMFGIMGCWNLPLNPANLVVLPLIIGISVDGGVHAVHDYLSQPRGYQMSSSMINALILNSASSMIGFGSMMIAQHRGLFSVGLVMTIGVGTSLFVSLVLLPAVLTLLPRREMLIQATQHLLEGELTNPEEQLHLRFVTPAPRSPAFHTDREAA